MKPLITVCVLLMAGFATTALAQQKPPAPPEKGTRIYQTDPYGRVQMSSFGRPQYNAPQYKIDGSKVYAADQYGRERQQAYKIERKTPPGPKSRAALRGRDGDYGKCVWRWCRGHG